MGGILADWVLEADGCVAWRCALFLTEAGRWRLGSTGVDGLDGFGVDEFDVLVGGGGISAVRVSVAPAIEERKRACRVPGC